jgi:phospholipid/cholesterol/gamma-HCH transport system substrate-binding protein
VAVALTPPIPVPAASYSAGDTLPPGPPAADFDQILSRVDTIGESVSLLARALQKEVIEAGTLKDLHRTIASTATLSAQLQSVLLQQNRNLTETMAAFRASATHLSSVADSAQIQATLVNLRQTSENAARFSANLDSTNTALRKALAQIQNGNGTVGKLLTDSLLYSDIRHLVAQTDSLMADFKKNPRKYINLKIF